MVHQHLESGLTRLNEKLMKGFLLHKDDKDNQNSHFFGGRFENIYIDQEKIPGLEEVFEIIKLHATRITGVKKEILQLGYWFNYMQPGDHTLPHSHDEDDELLSCVYYVSVPNNSGLLYLGENEERVTIEPEESLMVFFPPTLVHHVGVNKSKNNRLSIGINIGKN